MTVDSYLELFTTLFGWMFYGILWDVLVTTGLVYLPFVGILVDHWRRAHVAADGGGASGFSLRSIEQDLIIAITVIVMAAQPAPLTPLMPHVLSYTPPSTISDPSPSPVTAAATSTTYDTSGLGSTPPRVEVPMLWYAVMSMSSGVIHAIVEGIPTSANIRYVVEAARLATIEDARLRQEAIEFYRSCYVSARSKFHEERPDSPAIDRILAEYGHSDPEWMGSHIYRDTPGYYDTYRAGTPIEGWPFVASRDTEYTSTAPPRWGRPYCGQWWADGSRGLRKKLVDAAGHSAQEFVLFVDRLHALSVEKRQDKIARLVLQNAPPSWSSNDLVHGNRANDGLLGTLEQFGKQSASGVGTAIVSVVFSIVLTFVLQVAPMVQAVLLLGIYSLLPIVLVVSRYSTQAVMSVALAIFSVKFWTVLWYLALWVDQNLIVAMYPDADMIVAFATLDFEHSIKRIVLNLVTTSLYIGLPILWSAMLGWAGARVGQSLDAASTPFTTHAGSSGQSGLRAIGKLRR